MRVFLVDGTYELFRAHFGAPSAKTDDGLEVGAVRGLLRSMAALLREEKVSHIGCAFDHVIESFRNALFPGYKTSEGVPPELLAQFELAEEATRALGILTWPMVEFEADDAIATAAARLANDPRVEEVRIASPDKDLGQCVRGRRVTLVDRMRAKTLDEAGIEEKFGVPPASIPDWLALVGDAADGIPGVPKWGARSTSLVLARYGRLEAIPDRASKWDVKVRGAESLAESLHQHREEAMLYRTLATLRTDAPIACAVEDVAYTGPDWPALKRICERIRERLPKIGSEPPA